MRERERKEAGSKSMNLVVGNERCQQTKESLREEGRCGGGEGDHSSADTAGAGGPLPPFYLIYSFVQCL